MTYTKAEVLLQVENVSKSFDKPIIGNISFSIRNIQRPGVNQGQIVSLVGRSGNGKTTLFNILAGLLKPDTGVVKVLNRTSNTYEPVKEGEMGVVFQNSYIYEWRKIGDLLKAAADRNSKESKSTLKERVSDISTKMDITDLHNKFSSQISGGQRQRVAIAEQLLNGGDFILLDEPFSGLDTLTIDRVTKILTDVVSVDEYKTIIIVSHDLSNSLAISDKAFILARTEAGGTATVTREICLAEMGLAWQPEIKTDPRFRQLLEQIKQYL